MTDRVLRYYQYITDPEFVEHMITETGLPEDKQAIVRDFRRYSAETEFYADRAGLPIKRFRDISAGIHRRMVDELLRLALIGWRYEKEQKERNPGR